ncbi:GNAT family N-acetyltransferase [Vineibacter terrae]|uniref:GNAT family N-acetyltransferase n=1 Tax=Vineibacter terrae TaxID=2586908 RepID=UPI002E301D14|nr:GNAT family N-acetyltransferase [Vineibacter terrae]HEX2889860.1 GNAT family N-acetyltransferase [Vineibacter terrae]
MADTSSTLVVRRATEADAARVADMINTAFAEYHGKLAPAPSALAETAQSVAPQLASPAGGAVAVRLDAPAVIVGAVLFRPEDRDLYFGRLSVPLDQRRHGVAGALIRFVEDEARRRECAGIVLGVRLALPENQRLFARHGFAEVSRHAHDGYAQPTWIKMRKHLHWQRP